MYVLFIIAAAVAGAVATGIGLYPSLGLGVILMMPIGSSLLAGIVIMLHAYWPLHATAGEVDHIER